MQVDQFVLVFCILFAFSSADVTLVLNQPSSVTIPEGQTQVLLQYHSQGGVLKGELFTHSLIPCLGPVDWYVKLDEIPNPEGGNTCANQWQEQVIIMIIIL